MHVLAGAGGNVRGRLAAAAPAARHAALQVGLRFPLIGVSDDDDVPRRGSPRLCALRMPSVFNLIT